MIRQWCFMAFGIEKSLIHSVSLILRGTLLADAMAGSTKYILEDNSLPHYAGGNICSTTNFQKWTSKMTVNVTVLCLLYDDFLGYEKSQNHSIKIASIPHRQHRIEEVFCFITHYFLRKFSKQRVGLSINMARETQSTSRENIPIIVKLLNFPPMNSDTSDTLYVTIFTVTLMGIYVLEWIKFRENFPHLLMTVL